MRESQRLAGQTKTALAGLKELCQVATDDTSAIDSAVAALFEAGLREDLLSLLREQVKKNASTPGVTYVFVHMSTTMDQWDVCEEELVALQNRPKLWRVGAQKYLMEAAVEKQHVRFHRFLETHGEVLRADTEMWESVGDALCQGGMDQRTCDWMSDWRKRKAVTALGLLSLARSLWECKNDHKAARVSQHVIKHVTPDRSLGIHMTYAALHQIIYGNPKLAFDYIREVDPMEMNEYFQMHYEYVICILKSLEAGESYSELVTHLKTIAEHRDSRLSDCQVVLRIHKLCQWAAARLHNKKLRAFWFKRQAGKM